MSTENITELAEALLNLKFDIIIVNLVTACIAIIAMYFIVRLKKSAELTEINNNFATVVKQQKELVSETETIKQSLGKDSINYQIKLNAYHEKSIDTINTIYIQIIEMRSVAENFAFNPSEEVKSKLIKSIFEFRKEYEIKKIWLPSSLSTDIEEIANEINKNCFLFIKSNMRAETQELNDKQVQEIIDIQERFYDYINDEIIVIFDTLSRKISNEVSTEQA